MHHKRGRPKNRRAGCLLCKPWKANHAKRNRMERPFDNSKGNRRHVSLRREIEEAVAA